MMKPACTCSLQRSNTVITSPVAKFGGLPVFYEDAEWPECEQCGQEMDFIAQIPLISPMALSSRFAMAYVFMCPGEYSESGRLECKTFDAFSECNAVILQESSDSTHLGTRDSGPHFGSYPDYEVTLAQLDEPNLDTANTRNEEWPLRERISTETKIGGVPFWIQGNETPECIDCGDETTFVAQIDNGAIGNDLPDGDAKLGFGDAGRAYVFICRNDCSPHGGYFLWQCG